MGRNFIANLQTTGLPFVITEAHVRPLHVNCVMADIIHGVEQAIGHLVARGRQRIALVNGPSTTTTSEEKYKGFRLALSLHDLPFSPLQVVTADFQAESGYAQTLQLLKQMPDLDAIVYADDRMAIGGLHALKENGRLVPGDVAIIGFQGYEITSFTDPPLMSVQYDMQRVGIMAARRLCMMLEAPDEEAWCILVPTYLSVRKSA